jgi:hypothetical protein
MSDALYKKYRLLDMAPASDGGFAAGRRTHCCADMRDAVTHVCDQHADPFECPDNLIAYRAAFDEYGLIVHDGGASYVLISRCPWCGAQLPASRRDDWFDRLDALGLDPASCDDLPTDFKTDAWWFAASPKT